MQTATSHSKPQTDFDQNEARKPAPKPRRISWETFEKKYLGREDGNTYEWSNGLVETSPNSMGPNQLYIQFNLQELFMRLKFAGQISGQLLAEPELFFTPETYRRPDFAWLTQTQTGRLTEKGAIEIPAFVIEVISNNDAAQKVAEKMQLYRITGVQVVWLLFPNQEEVHVYAGQNLEQMTVCYGDKICSAAPALPAFDVPAIEIFQQG